MDWASATGEVLEGALWFPKLREHRMSGYEAFPMVRTKITIGSRLPFTVRWPLIVWMDGEPDDSTKSQS